MNIEKQFDFLKEYRFKFKEQIFKNVYNSYFTVHTYSFYNENGCFTIYNLPQRGEWDYFYAEKLSYNMDELLKRRIDIYSEGKDFWSKVINKKSYSIKMELNTLTEVIRYQIQIQNEFYGVKA